jgi:membrane protease YdiL (CAAX protease family)
MASNDSLSLPSSAPTDYVAGLPAPSVSSASAATGLPLRRTDLRPHPNFWWAILWCIGFVLFTQIPGAMTVLGVLGYFLVFRPDILSFHDMPAAPGELVQTEAFSHAMLVAFYVTEALVIGVSLLVIRLVVGRDWPRQLALRLPGLPHTLMALAAFPALVLTANGFYAFLRQVVHLPSISDMGVPGMEEMVKVFNGWPLPVAVLLIGMGPGIGEELWCRGFLGRGLVGRYGPVLGILFSSFFFGLIHVDPCQGTMAALLGLCLHYVYLTTRSLYLPILLHFLNNSLAVTAMRFERLRAVEESPSSIPLAVYAAAAALLIVIALALWGSRARLVSEDASEPGWRPDYPGVAYPPAGSGVRVERPGSMPALVVTTTALLAFGLTCWLACR